MKARRRNAGWRICPILALLALGAAGVGTSLAVSQPAEANLASTVLVQGGDAGARLSPKTVAAGKVVFKINNAGKKAHVFVLGAKGVAVRAHMTVTASIGLRPGKREWSWTGTTARGVLTVK